MRAVGAGGRLLEAGCFDFCMVLGLRTGAGRPSVQIASTLSRPAAHPPPGALAVVSPHNVNFSRAPADQGPNAPQGVKKSSRKSTAMTRNVIVFGGLAMIALVSVGSLASARMASTQLGTDGVRMATSNSADASKADAMPSVIKRDRTRAYWARVMTTNALDISRPTPQCATY
jgi:hypothetical protein